eukprot:SAG31_NODE_4668_length_3047_cov_1.961330_4_plen_63_part_00
MVPTRMNCRFVFNTAVDCRLVEVEKRIRDLNKTVPIVHCQNADVPVESVIGIGAFSLDEVGN